MGDQRLPGESVSGQLRQTPDVEGQERSALLRQTSGGWGDSYPVHAQGEHTHTHTHANSHTQ